MSKTAAHQMILQSSQWQPPLVFRRFCIYASIMPIPTFMAEHPHPALLNCNPFRLRTAWLQKTPDLMIFLGSILRGSSTNHCKSDATQTIMESKILEDTNKLFPRYQAIPSNTKQYQKSGLGLVSPAARSYLKKVADLTGDKSKAPTQSMPLEKSHLPDTMDGTVGTALDGKCLCCINQ